MSSQVVATEGITKHFGAFAALSRVTFGVSPGEIRGLIGPNGAGKSTLLHLLAGRHKPSAGRVLLDGRDVTSLPPRERARLGIGIKFQITSVVSSVSVEDNILLAAQAGESWLSLLRSSRREQRRRVADLLAQVGLYEKRDWIAGWLSHGEQQWLEIAMALALQPRVLLLDEPTSGMSVRETHVTAALIEQLRGSVTIIVVEHDIAFIKLISDRLTVLDRGGILAEGSVAEVENDARVQAAYLRRGSLAHRAA